MAKNGKAAVEKETAISVMGRFWRLFAKLKTAILPTAKVEPIAVITIKLIWLAANPKDLGRVNFMVFITPGWEKFKIFRGLNPVLKRMGS